MFLHSIMFNCKVFVLNIGVLSFLQVYLIHLRRHKGTDCTVAHWRLDNLVHIYPLPDDQLTSLAQADPR